MRGILFLGIGEACSALRSEYMGFLRAVGRHKSAYDRVKGEGNSPCRPDGFAWLSPGKACVLSLLVYIN